MKNVYRIVLTAVLMVAAVSTNAQNLKSNRYTISDDCHNITMEVSDNTSINMVSDKLFTTSIGGPENKTIHANAETHNLIIHPEGEWSEMRIVGPNGFHRYIMDFMGEFNESVEDGDYVVFVTGGVPYNGTYRSGWLGYDITVDHDITMNPSMSEAQFQLSVEGKDENGNPIEQQAYLQNITEVHIGFKTFGEGSISLGGSSLITVFCNELSDSFSISATQSISVEGQTSYFIQYPTHYGKLDGDLHMSNEPSEFETNKYYYNLRNNNNSNNVSFYSVDYMNYCVSQDNDIYYCDKISSQIREMTIDPSVPIRLITNVKVDDQHLYYDKGFCVSKPFVSVYENYNPNVSSDYHEQLVSPGAYLNGEGNWIRESFGDIPYISAKKMEYFDPMSPTPAACVAPASQPSFLGERTPFLYWQAENYGPSNSVSGDAYFSGVMQYIGDNGCIRKSDESANIVIRANNSQIFNDSVYKFNQNRFSVDEPCEISMEVTDTYLIDDGIIKFNVTLIDFDLNRDDAMPPTLTMLRVVNDNGQENVYLPDYNDATIVFGAGDFEHLEPGGYFGKMLYKGKPEIYAYYSLVGGGQWMELQYTENENLFHVNYGNVFTIDLSQLGDDAADKWITLRFVVIDEAGNRQIQELYDVFYTGQQTSVNEQSSNLSHNVYPNPFSSELHINTVAAVDGIAQVSVFNILGEQVVSKTMHCNGTTEFIIDGGNFTSGIYFYHISTENGTIRGSVIKE